MKSEENEVMLISHSDLVKGIDDLDISKTIKTQYIPEWILFLKDSTLLDWEIIAKRQGISCSLFSYITDFDILVFSTNIGNTINMHTVESRKYEISKYDWYFFAKHVIIDKVQISNLLYKFFSYKNIFSNDFSYKTLVESFNENMYGIDDYKKNITNKFKIIL